MHDADVFDAIQEVDVLKSVSYDRNVVQFYGTCPLGDQTMLVLEYMEVSPVSPETMPVCAASVSKQHQPALLP